MATTHRVPNGPIEKEPIEFYGGGTTGSSQLGVVLDEALQGIELVYPARSRRTDPGRVTGAKPATFCRWIFDLLGAQAGDQFRDLFPGSGGVTRAWTAFSTGLTSGWAGESAGDRRAISTSITG